MELFMQEIMPSVLSLLAVVIGGVFTWIGSALRKYLKEKGIIEKIKERPRLAYAAVLAVEDAYKEADGETKLKNAIKIFVGMAQETGLPISYEDADSLVRSAYQAFKNGLKEEGVVIVESLPAPDIETEVKDGDVKPQV